MSAVSEEYTVILQLADQVTHNIDIVRRDDEGAGRHTLDLAVVGVGGTGEEGKVKAGSVIGGGGGLGRGGGGGGGGGGVYRLHCLDWRTVA